MMELRVYIDGPMRRGYCDEDEASSMIINFRPITAEKT